MRSGDPEIVSKLLQQNSGVLDIKSKNGRSPLHTASIHGNLECIKIILSYTTQPIFYLTSRDSCGSTPVMDSVRGGHLQVMEYLSQIHPESINTQDSLGRNVLHIASHCGQHLIVENLISQHRMNVNDDSSPTSPLHWAAKEGQVQVVELLLKLGANRKKRDHCRRTPLALAIGGW